MFAHYVWCLNLKLHNVCTGARGTGTEVVQGNNLGCDANTEHPHQKRVGTSSNEDN